MWQKSKIIRLCKNCTFFIFFFIPEIIYIKVLFYIFLVLHFFQNFDLHPYLDNSYLKEAGLNIQRKCFKGHWTYKLYPKVNNNGSRYYILHNFFSPGFFSIKLLEIIIKLDVLFSIQVHLAMKNSLQTNKSKCSGKQNGNADKFCEDYAHIALKQQKWKS